MEKLYLVDVRDSHHAAGFGKKGEGLHWLARRHLPIPDLETVVCGMSLGHADPDAPENALVTERAPAREFAALLGWD